WVRESARAASVRYQCLSIRAHSPHSGRRRGRAQPGQKNARTSANSRALEGHVRLRVDHYTGHAIHGRWYLLGKRMAVQRRAREDDVNTSHVDLAPIVRTEAGDVNALGRRYGRRLYDLSTGVVVRTNEGRPARHLRRARTSLSSHT